jgi:mRNA-degrading endonuclease RelE of RelBE toxin-antitoxin system
MFQLNFSEQSLGELNKLDIFGQLRLVNQISNVSAERLVDPNSDIGKFHRESKVFYRLRADEFRVYFERQDSVLYCHYILHRNTLTDFLFRIKMPVTEEQMVEQHESFWKYLETLKRERKKLPVNNPE